MKSKLTLWLNKHLNDSLDLREQIFHQLLIVGICLGILIGISSIITHAGIGSVVINFVTAAAAFAVLEHGGRIRKNTSLYLGSVIIVFMIIFPVLFFTSGGYHGGTPSFFVFAIAFTVFILKGKTRNVTVGLEIALYIGICSFAYDHPETVKYFETERDTVWDIVTGFAAASAALGVTVYRYTRIYDKKQKQIEDANKRLSELDRLKTEFLQDMRHEMQNPLTTIARGIEFAENLTGRPDKSDMARNALKLAQEEALRVGRMVESMISLATMSGGADRREKVNFESLLVNCAETFRLQLGNRKNSLTVDVDPGLPYVYGVADQLKQVLINLFQNTARHTRNGAVTLQAFRGDMMITVSVSDTGEGIAPDVLTHVFERGFSGEKSSGYGLAICRTIVEAHGGVIQIESEPGKGTAVTFTIPVYGGQSETRGKSG